MISSCLIVTQLFQKQSETQILLLQKQFCFCKNSQHFRTKRASSGKAVPKKYKNEGIFQCYFRLPLYTFVIASPDGDLIGPNK
jgi:hypothetical protein